MDVLPHSTDIFEGPTHKEAQEAVKTRVEVEECVEDIIREVQDIALSRDTFHARRV